MARANVRKKKILYGNVHMTLYSTHTHKEVEADRGRHKRRRKIFKISRILRRNNRNEKGKTTTELQNNKTTET